MDVWVDSGLSHHCVSRIRPEIRTPADLYLEGSDQHRGWFHSSLLTSVAQKGHAPYRGVLTHGFTVDEKGRKMSKSLGNVVLPQKVVSTLGADVLRLWVAATDYANEISVSDEILKRMSDSYRRIRNTAALPARQPGRLRSGGGRGADANRWSPSIAGRSRARARCRRRSSRRTASYDFHLIYQKLHNFCVVDLGGFYLDVIKDRLYTTPARGLPRRSAQTAMCSVAEAMVRWLAPILSFTAEEIWRLPARLRARSRCSTRPGRRSRRLPAESAADGLGEGAGGTRRPCCASSSAAGRGRDRCAARRRGRALRRSGDASGAGRAGRRTALRADHLRGARARRGRAPRCGGAGERGGQEPGLWLRVYPSTATKCVRCWHKRADVGQRRRAPRTLRRAARQRRWPG